MGLRSKRLMANDASEAASLPLLSPSDPLLPLPIHLEITGHLQSSSTSHLHSLPSRHGWAGEDMGTNQRNGHVDKHRMALDGSRSPAAAAAATAAAAGGEEH